MAERNFMQAVRPGVHVVKDTVVTFLAHVGETAVRATRPQYNERLRGEGRQVGVRLRGEEARRADIMAEHLERSTAPLFITTVRRSLFSDASPISGDLRLLAQEYPGRTPDELLALRRTIVFDQGEESVASYVSLPVTVEAQAVK